MSAERVRISFGAAAEGMRIEMTPMGCRAGERFVGVIEQKDADAVMVRWETQPRGLPPQQRLPRGYWDEGAPVTLAASSAGRPTPPAAAGGGGGAALIYVQIAREEVASMGCGTIAADLTADTTPADVLSQLGLPAHRVLMFAGERLDPTTPLSNAGITPEAVVDLPWDWAPPFAFARCHRDITRHGTDAISVVANAGICNAVGEFGCPAGARVRWRVQNFGSKGGVGLVACSSPSAVGLSRSPNYGTAASQVPAWNYVTGQCRLYAMGQALQQDLPQLAVGEGFELRLDRVVHRAEWWVRGGCVAAVDASHGLPTDDTPLHFLVTFGDRSGRGEFRVVVQELFWP